MPAPLPPARSTRGCGLARATCAAGPGAGAGAVARLWRPALEAGHPAAQAVAVLRVCGEAGGEAQPVPLLQHPGSPSLRGAREGEEGQGPVCVNSFLGRDRGAHGAGTVRPVETQAAVQGPASPLRLLPGEPQERGWTREGASPLPTDGLGYLAGRACVPGRRGSSSPRRPPCCTTAGPAGQPGPEQGTRPCLRRKREAGGPLRGLSEGPCHPVPCQTASVGRGWGTAEPTGPGFRLDP